MHVLMLLQLGRFRTVAGWRRTEEGPAQAVLHGERAVGAARCRGRSVYCHHFSSNKPAREPFPDGLAEAALGSGFAVDSVLGVLSAGFEEGLLVSAEGSLGVVRSLRFGRGVARTTGGAAAVEAAAVGAAAVRAGAAGAAEAIGGAACAGATTLVTT